MMSVLSVRLKRLLPVDAVALYLLRDDVLVPEFVTGDNARLFSSLRIPVGQGLSGWVAENRKPIVNGNPSVEPGYLNDPNIFSTLRSALAVPLNIEQTVIGVLTIYHEDRDAFTKDHLTLAETLAPKLAHSVEHSLRAGEAVSADVSRFDVLTGLPQARSMFHHLDTELSRCRRLNIGLGVVVCSLDGLKRFNEKHGRVEGDKAIRTIASALRADCREFEFVARMGVTDFILVLPGMRPDMIAGKLERLATVTGSKGNESVTLITGEAFFPDDANDAEQLIAEADRRMLQKKQLPPAQLPAPIRSSAWVQ
jgi:diguanylate cyclase (GGDEF)-like protein